MLKDECPKTWGATNANKVPKGLPKKSRQKGKDLGESKNLNFVGVGKRRRTDTVWKKKSTRHGHKRVIKEFIGGSTGETCLPSGNPGRPFGGRESRFQKKKIFKTWSERK